MKSNHNNRREFIKKAAGVTAGAILAPTILSSCAKGSNDRIYIAHIGNGGRGSGVTKSYFLPVPDSRSVATCDPFTDRREKLAKEISAYYKEKYDETVECTPYLKFEELLERSDIDAVHIATGDYWHVPIALAAARAGKHIYCEKPLGLSLDNMIELEKTMSQKNLVFQYGTQQRSLDHIKKGAEMVRSGKLGEIEKIDIWAPGGQGVPKKSVEIKDPPANLDYDRWLGPAPLKPYCDARVTNLGIWYIYDYAIGFIAGWGAHPLDVAIFGAKEQMNDTGTYTCSGKFFPESVIYDTISEWDMNIEYKNGLKIHFVSTNLAEEMMKNLDHGNGTTFYGTKGWISLGRGAAASSIPELHKELNTTVYGENNRHGLNFIKSVKGEIEPFNPLDEAILSDCISHMGNILVRSGKEEVVWNPKSREIENHPELVREFFHRDLREPYGI